VASGYGIPVTAPEESLAESFRAVARELRRRTLVALEPWDVTPSQARALGMLHRHGAMRLRDLAEHLRIAPRSATEVVDDLAGRGLVDRHPDPDDRRAVLVRPTERGEGAPAQFAGHGAERLGERLLGRGHGNTVAGRHVAPS
jgi:DNA-binding MarR family transcriptional regulator